MNRHFYSFGLLALHLVGCGAEEGGEGRLRVLLEAEDTITGGLEPGDGGEDIRDGWSVSFDSYLAAIGNVTVRSATDGAERRGAADTFVVDLTEVPESGEPLWELDALGVGRWSFGYSIALGDPLRRHSNVDRDTFDAFVDAERPYRVVGTVEKDDGVSCPPPNLASTGELTSTSANGGGVECYPNPVIAFDLSLGADVAVGPCERDGGEGFAVGDAATTTVAVTIHGDHAFFNGFPESAEGGVLRLVQWFADCDLNVDGEVTHEELSSIAPSDLWELDADRYQFGGSPITPLEDMRTYLDAQLSTQGHFQGEGECPIRFED